jgi:hypothetical protein
MLHCEKMMVALANINENASAPARGVVATFAFNACVTGVNLICAPHKETTGQAKEQAHSKRESSRIKVPGNPIASMPDPARAQALEITMGLQ